MLFGRARQPFVGLALAAVAGIVLEDTVRAPFMPLAGLAAASLLVWAFARRSAAFWLLVLLSFAMLHRWQSIDSASAMLAKRLTAQWQPASILGEVATPPSGDPERPRFLLRVRELAVAGSALHAGCLVAVRWTGPAPAYGDRVSIHGSIRNIPPPRNPGQFDFPEWMRRRGVESEIMTTGAQYNEVLGSGGSPLIKLALSARSWLQRTLTLGIADAPYACGVILGMTLGLTGDTPEEVEEAFRRTGTLHLFSVSGLHVGMIAAILWFVLTALGCGRRQAVLVIIPCLFFYAVITGLKPAGVRAATMISILFAGLLIDRQPVPLNSLGAAAFLILPWNTNELFNPGFQISFAVVAAIFLVGVPVKHRLERLVAPDPFIPTQLLTRSQRAGYKAWRAFSVSLAVSLAAWLGSLPLIFFYFHLVSFSALAANLLVVPLAFATLSVAILSAAGGVFSAWVAEAFNHANLLLTELLLAIIGFFAGLPGSYLYVGMPEFLPPREEVVVFDCGEGGALSLRAGRSWWLVDTGSSFEARTTLLPFLRSRGVNALNGLILTHGDARHIGGSREILGAIKVRAVFESAVLDRSPVRRRLREFCEEFDAPLGALQSGRTLPLSADARLTVLYPPADLVHPLADDKALVLRIDLGAVSLLLLSDAGQSTEEWLLAKTPDLLDADVLVMGRHQSGLSGGRAFFNAVRPRVVVASAADFPRSEQISSALLEAVASVGAVLFRQDETGAVTIRVDSPDIEVTGFLNGQRFDAGESSSDRP